MGALTLADANRVSLAYSKETDWGEAIPTSPAPTMQALRFTSESLTYDKSTAVSNEIRSDRMVPNLVEVGDAAGGGINIEMSALSFEDFILAAISQDAWSGSAPRTAKNGTTKTSFLIEKHFADIDKFVVYQGMRVNNWTLNLQAQQIATGSFTFNGKQAATGTATVSASITGATATDVLSASANVANLKYNGSAIAAVRRLDLNLTNNLGPQPIVGSKYPAGVRYGRLDITGTMEVYVQDLALFTDLINHTTVSVSFDLSDGTNVVSVNLPTVKLSRGNPNATGINTDVMLALDWQAIRDPSTDEVIDLALNP